MAPCATRCARARPFSVWTPCLLFPTTVGNVLACSLCPLGCWSQGFSVLLGGFAQLGFLNMAAAPEVTVGAPIMSRRAFFASAVQGASPSMDNNALLSLACQQVGLGADITTGEAKRFADAVAWVGLLSDADMPQKGTKLDSFVAVLTAKPEMAYAGKERDMCLMHHEIEVRFPATGLRQLHTATLVQYTENGVTSMSKTVGLTAAIGTQMILDGQGTGLGMVTPIKPEWYMPILDVLHHEGVEFYETVKDL